VPAGAGEELQGIKKVSLSLQLPVSYHDIKKRLPQIARTVKKGITAPTIAAEEFLFFLDKD